jgi:hypothetical protein
MPKLGEYQYLLDVVFSLYPDVASARAGVGAGGTGFFVAIPSTTSDWLHAYAVTNWHVALGHGDKPPSPIIRVNRKFGPPKIFDVDPADWQFIGGHHDVAVLPIEFDTDEVKAKVIGIKGFFLSDADIAMHEVNVGEDAFMLSRFIDYDGVEASVPSMRFGNLSVMKARLVQLTGCKEPSFVVDMHSGPGCFGSPVFIYRTHGSSFAKDKINVMGLHFLKLLGILWGQFPEEWDANVGGQPLEASRIVSQGNERDEPRLPRVCYLEGFEYGGA